MLYMMKRSALATVVLALLIPAAAAAQAVVIGEAPRRAWLGISFETEYVRPADGGTRQVIRITEVVTESPAERAGLAVGDTIISVNDIPASQQLISSLSFSLSPGESVRLRVRRNGAERQVDVVTAERAARMFGVEGGRVITIDMDSVRQMTRTWLDSARVQLDTLDMTLQRIMPGVIMRRDFPNPDSLRAHIHYRMRDDTLAPGVMRVVPFDGDTLLLRAEMDSVLQRLMRVRGGIPVDTAQARVLRGVLPPPGFDGVSFFAARAVAGAELADLDPAMEPYFGTREGVLVVRVAEATPAARAGLRAGDVIIGVNEAPVGDTAGLRRRIGQAQRGERVRLDVLRERRALRLELGGS
jgi:membrane-associated protease RseP (regulator of RpoE activity)